MGTGSTQITLSHVNNKFPEGLLGPAAANPPRHFINKNALDRFSEGRIMLSAVNSYSYDNRFLVGYDLKPIGV